MAIISTKSYGVARGTSSGGTSSGSSRSSSVSYTNTDYAEEAGHAKEADEADYADEAGYAKKAGYASTAGSLSSSAGGYLSADDDDIAEGAIAFTQGIYVGEGADDEGGSDDDDDEEADEDDDDGVDFSGCQYSFSADGTLTASKVVTGTSVYDTDGNDLLTGGAVWRVVPTAYSVLTDGTSNAPSGLTFAVRRVSGGSSADITSAESLEGYGMEAHWKVTYADGTEAEGGTGYDDESFGVESFAGAVSSVAITLEGSDGAVYDSLEIGAQTVPPTYRIVPSALALSYGSGDEVSLSVVKTSLAGTSAITTEEALEGEGLSIGLSAVPVGSIILVWPSVTLETAITWSDETAGVTVSLLDGGGVAIDRAFIYFSQTTQSE